MGLSLVVLAAGKQQGQVLQDVRDGFVSIEAARHDYGVAVTGDRLDLVTTRMLREAADAAG